MALRKIDSCDHYATADIIKKWPYSVGVTGNYTVVSGGRIGNRLSNVLSIAGHLTDAFDNQPTWIAGGYFTFNGYTSQSIGDIVGLIGFRDDTTMQLSCCSNYAGKIAIYRGDWSATQIAISSAPVISPNSAHYIEFKATIHGSDGTYEVRVDGITVLSGSSANTKVTTNAYANRVSFYPKNNINLTFHIEDMYICDGTGSAPCNNFLGDCKVIACLPTGNGTTSNFVGSDSNSTDNYLLVDEVAPNTSDYLDSSTVNHVDLVTFADITDIPSIIYGVQTNIYACKSDAGARTFSDYMKSGTAVLAGTEKALTTDWTYYNEIHELNPDTGAAWTKTNFNSAEFGVKVVS